MEIDAGRRKPVSRNQRGRWLMNEQRSAALWAVALIALAGAPGTVSATTEMGSGAESNVAVRYEPARGLRLSTRDGNNAVTLGGRVQLRYSATDRDDGDDESRFNVPRARLTAGGHFYRPALRYYFQGDFADDFDLRDAVLEAVVSPALGARAGQFKIPFNRAQIASSASLQFVERAVSVDEFLLGDSGRDIGVQIGGTVVPERLQYAVGAFNGAGPNSTDRDSNHLFVGRLLWTPLAAFADYYDEGDLLGEPEPRLGFGASFAFSGDEDGGRTTTRRGLTDRDQFPSFSGADIFAATGDVHFKTHGLSALVDYHYRRVDPKGGGIAAFDGHGINLQAGYFIVPQKVEMALRIAWVDPNSAQGSDDILEYGFAAGYFLVGHRIKLQSDVRYIETERPGASTTGDLAFRLQAQVTF